MVLIVPNEHISERYFKSIANSLNTSFKFTFGSILPKLLNTSPDNPILDLSSIQDISELSSIKLEMDKFFSLFNARLTKASLFRHFNDGGHQTKPNAENVDKNYKMSCSHRIEMFKEMQKIFTNSIPFLDIPHPLSSDLDNILADLEAQEFIDLENAFNRYMRLFSINGSCLFYKVIKF
jgi:hypothetical protein